MEWYQKSVHQAIKDLSADPARGLTDGEARERLGRWGTNTLAEPEKESSFIRFLKQFAEFIIIVLIGAAMIAGALGEWVDSIAILSIVLLNGVIGFIQERKAERVMEALKKLATPTAKVLRDGGLSYVPSASLVPGDTVVLEAGDYAPADCRVIETSFLKVEEAALTGESQAVEKETGAIEKTVPLADRTNMVYLGTTAVYGRGKAAVVSTGMATEMGKIARLLQGVKQEPTPLQKKLSEFSRRLVYAAGAICALIFVLGIMRGEGAVEMFLTSVSLAVAAIPEGLPAVVTITLALGVQRMVNRHAIIKKLPSVETLGSATVIASDKTGTITQNQMTVKKIYLPGGDVVSVTGSGYAPEGRFYRDSQEIDPALYPDLLLAIKAGVLCNGAELKKTDNGWSVVGDPTEGALLTLGLKAGMEKGALAHALGFAGEVPFDASRKLMTMVYRGDGLHYAFVKGAVERILPLCTSIFDGKASRPIEEADMERIRKAADGLSTEALRVLALAFRESSEELTVEDPAGLEKDLTFIAVAGMLDPPREEISSAVKVARSAGITPIMITGDHKLTAVAIARETDIFRDGDIAVTGTELDAMGAEEFREKLPRIKIYARVNPEHKLKVVKAWKGIGEVICMTGDGVNDAPALKEADIGVAMGITGTDVTKEASDMVLTDDNFASIVSAVEEGRGIFDNIRRVIHFLLSCNIGEILVLLIASLVGMPLPLLPVQILWTNLVTDGLPALGLAMERVDPTVMERMPRKRDEGIVTGRLLGVMTLQGVFIALCTLSVFALEVYYFGAPLMKAQTMAFTVLVFCQKFHVFNCRSVWESVFKIGVFSNNMLNWAVATILATQLIVIYVPPLQPIFKVAPLGWFDWVVVTTASVQPLVMMEIVKAVLSKRWMGRQEGA
ncbi:MAG: cation-translocating P-type ATPase [Deltaproteobacteria bacterium]|nr:cation-translocating P-type ATPase [Deltaproteobacteria bacterium]